MIIVLNLFLLALHLRLQRKIIYYYTFIIGQQRSRMLATLFKDERCQSLPEFSILEKMYLDRIIRPNEIAQLDAMLQPHQKAKTVDGNSLQ